MNWEMLAAIGQMAAVCVGIPSLIYLAVQIREQTKERRLSAVNALTVQWGDLTRALHDSAEFSSIFLRGLQSFDDLDSISKVRFSAFFNRFFKNFQAMYFAHQDGILTSQLWGEIERTMTDLLGYVGLQQWWKTRRHWQTEEFARVVDEIIARGEKPKAYATYDLSQITREADKGSATSAPFAQGYGAASERMTDQQLKDLASRYATAWCSRDPQKVAAFFAERGSLSVNDGPAALGRAPIAEIARGFMHDFPDMVVTFDKLEPQGDRVAFHWTLIGTNTGPGGTGNKVRISGYELWKIDNDGLIAESKGHFDAADYERQLKQK